MPYLAAITVIWALSFNLIGTFLAGRVDADFAVLTRVVLAGLVFLPFLRWRQVSPPLRIGLIMVGAMQFGVTYLCLYRAFRFLTVPEVLLFTIFTPIYITLIDDAMSRRFNPRALLAALVAVAGAAIVRYDALTGDYLAGFLLLQLANLSFAAGQIGYKHLLRRHPSPLPQHASFGLFFVGALAVALPSWLLFGNPAKLPTTEAQWAVLVFLGLVSTALGYFWWNKGACMVDAGRLGAMNNMHIPVGIAISLVTSHPEGGIGRMLLGGAVIASSLLLAPKKNPA
ncbi:carboxylate/amino acid/amine transporter [Jeongeupia chitinilytica]|uniref:Membrane protein n=1 Tax=Jeongeupia chitinilytica TaxID=1041641 RepID=A0ABQ3GY30_9NEIS|nr:carboxylate/amino acid/amine transporter [Jeongeupia chitinilytica]GHD56872.1 putative membrane protein [Jeongeupia chitinilytica]